MQRLQYKVQNQNHVVVMQDDWRKLPFVLARIRGVPSNIIHAQMTQEHAAIYLNETSHTPVPAIEAIVAAEIAEEEHHLRMPSVQLPVDTKIKMYNLPNLPYTTMEFSCKDRIGLLHDLFSFISSMPLEIHSAYITTIEHKAYNILHLQKDGKHLKEKEMEYVLNVFEHEGKERSPDINDPMY